MLRKSDRSVDHNSMNKLIGNNLRFIRRLKKMSLMQLANKMNIKYQQVGKYELGQNQLCAFRLWQASHILGCKIKYFFDKDYITKMYGYHSANIRRNSAMPSELLDVDQLQLELDNELAYIDFREEQKNANV